MDICKVVMECHRSLWIIHGISMDNPQMPQREREGEGLHIFTFVNQSVSFGDRWEVCANFGELRDQSRTSINRIPDKMSDIIFEIYVGRSGKYRRRLKYVCIFGHPRDVIRREVRGAGGMHHTCDDEPLSKTVCIVFSRFSMLRGVVWLSMVHGFSWFKCFWHSRVSPINLMKPGTGDHLETHYKNS